MAVFDSIRHSIRETNTPFGRVTGVAALVVACSTLVDALTTPGAETVGYSIIATVLALGFAAYALAVGSRLHPVVGLCAVLFLGASLTFLIVHAPSAALSANNFLLLPMLAVYLGWFYPTRVATATGAVIMVSVTIAVALNPFESIWTAYTNALLVSGFSLFSSGFLQRQLNHLARTDALTGALNRRGFERACQIETARAQRLGQPLSLVVIDFDDFKQINDSRGHAAGDQELINAVRNWRSVLRPYDWICRLGGDEFVLLLAGTTEKDAEATVERLRAASSTPWSVGIVQLHTGEEVPSAIRRADALLYQQKEGQR